jgi:hypothetical protein
MTCRNITLLFLPVLLAVNAPAASASEDGGPPMPPPAAFTACEGKKAGDKAESVTPDGRTITGICEERDGRLFLRPDHLPQQQGQNGAGGPPPAAFTACEGKKAGDKAESVTPDGRTITGTCEERDGRLFLRPDHLPQQSDSKQ